MRILFNGHIHTNQPGVLPVSALAVDHGQIIAVGSDNELRRAIWRACRAN